jgi:hypothetical protein
MMVMELINIVTVARIRSNGDANHCGNHSCSLAMVKGTVSEYFLSICKRTACTGTIALSGLI